MNSDRPSLSFSLIIPAAGSGSRSGQALPKQYVELLGVPVLAHTLRAFARLEECAEIVVAIDEEWRQVAEGCAEGIPNVRFVPGGSQRQHSIANALAGLHADTELVLVHDAARPCVAQSLVERVVHAAALHGAAIPALPINETVKRVDDDGRIVETIPRAHLRAAQTPQGFRREILRAAYRHAAERNILGTDDASLAEALGAPVYVVEGAVENIKITVPEDFARAEEYLRKYKV